MHLIKFDPFTVWTELIVWTLIGLIILYVYVYS